MSKSLLTDIPIIGPILEQKQFNKDKLEYIKEIQNTYDRIAELKEVLSSCPDEKNHDLIELIISENQNHLTHLHQLFNTIYGEHTLDELLDVVDEDDL